jgi:hypothetical protein
MPGFTRHMTRYNKTPARRKIPGVGAETYRGTRVNITAGILTDLVTPTSVVVTFSKPVIYSGILPGWTSGGDTVTIVTQIDALNYTVTFSGAIGAAADVLIPFEDPAFRDSSGGYLQPGTIVTS